MVTISTHDAGSNPGKLWEQAAREPVTVVEAGRPVAVVLSPDAYHQLAGYRQPREAGTGRHLFAGVDINALLAVDITECFTGYLP